MRLRSRSIAVPLLALLIGAAGAWLARAASSPAAIEARPPNPVAGQTVLLRETSPDAPDAAPVPGAWWDFVDAIAGRQLGDILRTDPARMSKLMRRWARDPNMWKRRAAILCQLGFKRETDLTLLYDCIEPNLGDKEFFIRKAIGWALRQHAWTDPREVKRYVKANRDRLSGLSVREALKNI